MFFFYYFIIYLFYYLRIERDNYIYIYKIAYACEFYSCNYVLPNLFFTLKSRQIIKCVVFFNFNLFY